MTLVRRHAIDTNLYIDAQRTDAGTAALKAFQEAHTAFVVLSAVVVQELRAGTRPGRPAAALESQIAPFERRQRIITPTYWAWKETGRLLAELVGRGDWSSLPRSLINDVLLAMSCRESGVVLVTANLRDFKRIAAVTPFDFVAPWPGMSA